VRVPVPTAQKIRFGAFELDRQTAELYKNGTKLKLQGQPIAVLALLLERPGELVTREEIRKHLWPEDTFVDFEHSLNTHIKKLRRLFDDDAEIPRYIETLPRRGYRFVALVEPVTNGDAVPHEPVPSPKPRRWKYAAVAAILLAIASAALYWIYRPRIPVVTGIHQLTHTGRRKALEWPAAARAILDLSLTERPRTTGPQRVFVCGVSSRQQATTRRQK
jgi:DNA-binding winged helix-turn-helix (wHTH) protein